MYERYHFFGPPCTLYVYQELIKIYTHWQDITLRLVANKNGAKNYKIAKHKKVVKGSDERPHHRFLSGRDLISVCHTRLRQPKRLSTAWEIFKSYPKLSLPVAIWTLSNTSFNLNGLTCTSQHLKRQFDQLTRFYRATLC